MTEDADDALEPVHEDIHHHAHAARERWIAAAAVTTAILAALAAITGSLASHALTLSTRDQIKSNDLWGYYQAKSIKATVVRIKPQLNEMDRQKLDEYDHDMKEKKEEAEAAENASEASLHKHEVLENAVTFFHISIPIVAIAILTKRRMFWYGSIVFGLIGIVFMARGLIAPQSPEHAATPATAHHAEK
jgi:hypothetical protein